MRVQNRLPCTKCEAGQIGRREKGRDSELDPCLAWVRREQKAAAKSARFGVRFTQMYSFSAYTFRVERVPKPDPASQQRRNHTPLQDDEDYRVYDNRRGYLLGPL